MQMESFFKGNYFFKGQLGLQQEPVAPAALKFKLSLVTTSSFGGYLCITKLKGVAPHKLVHAEKHQVTARCSC